MIAPVYTAEVAPASSRGFLTSFPEVFINTGVLLGKKLSPAMVRQGAHSDTCSDESEKMWRWDGCSFLPDPTSRPPSTTTTTSPPVAAEPWPRGEDKHVAGESMRPCKSRHSHSMRFGTTCQSANTVCHLNLVRQSSKIT
ncbi:uncharacterized protein LOC131151266 [Malania oleifera]|uniref:uncharacterized protein LOC131151266 n=1 Tax=Malania oleifera TaxID=397392 RepID=UPI0025ADEAEF|nr:uncharacterized protein LOC131151266 [Malania oleifera]